MPARQSSVNRLTFRRPFLGRSKSGDNAYEESRLPPGWMQPATYRAEVHQASGMISVQLNVSLAEALVRLRAHAYAQERPIAEVAADVVARRLRFEEPNR